jgi:hypothetical protein
MFASLNDTNGTYRREVCLVSSIPNTAFGYIHTEVSLKDANGAMYLRARIVLAKYF